MSRSFPWSSKGSCSRTWAARKAVKPLLNKGLRKIITTGTSTSSWNDTWSSLGNLRSILSSPLNYQEENSLVAQFVDDYGNWKWDNLSFVLPQSLLSIINAIPVNHSSFCEDLTAWAPSKDGNFSLKSAYSLGKGLNVLNLPTLASSWI